MAKYICGSITASSSSSSHQTHHTHTHTFNPGTIRKLLTTTPTVKSFKLNALRSHYAKQLPRRSDGQEVSHRNNAGKTITNSVLCAYTRTFETTNFCGECVQHTLALDTRLWCSLVPPHGPIRCDKFLGCPWDLRLVALRMARNRIQLLYRCISRAIRSSYRVYDFISQLFIDTLCNRKPLTKGKKGKTSRAESTLRSWQ